MHSWELFFIVKNPRMWKKFYQRLITSTYYSTICLLSWLMSLPTNNLPNKLRLGQVDK